MRYIILKNVETRKYTHEHPNYRGLIPPEDEWVKIKLPYREVIERICCEGQDTPQGGRSGFDREANRRALRILDALEKAELGNVLVLEDADWDYLKTRLAGHTWGWADHAFEDFCLAIETAPKDAPVEKAEVLDGEAAHLNGGMKPALVVPAAGGSDQ